MGKVVCFKLIFVSGPVPARRTTRSKNELGDKGGKTTINPANAREIIAATENEYVASDKREEEWMRVEEKRRDIKLSHGRPV